MNPIYPCLWFDGHAKIAAEFYCKVFDNSKIRVDTPMVVNFELTGKKFMGLNGGPNFKFNPSISFFVNCVSIAQTNETWNQLIQGGKALMPIGKYPWSECYGWVQDQFGLTWQLSYNPAITHQNIIPSLLFTSQHYGEAEEAIHLYTSLFDNSSTEFLSHHPNGTEHEGKLLFSRFNLNHYEMIAMDGPGVHDYTFNEAISFVVDCETQEEIDFYWNHLTKDGGQESRCGWLKDKFGVSWQIIPLILGQLMSDPAKAPRVMEAFLKMKKFDIDQLMKA